MAVSKCFVVPSRMESFGIVYAESICSGLPIIGYPQSVREISGLLEMPCGLPFDATTNDHILLGRLIKQIMLDSNWNIAQRAEMAFRGRERFATNEKFGDAYISFYQNILVH